MILVDGDVTVTVPVLCSDDFFSIPFIHLVHNFLATLRTHAMHVAETEYPPGQIQRHGILFQLVDLMSSEWHSAISFDFFKRPAERACVAHTLIIPAFCSPLDPVNNID